MLKSKFPLSRSSPNNTRLVTKRLGTRNRFSVAIDTQWPIAASYLPTIFNTGIKVENSILWLKSRVFIAKMVNSTQDVNRVLNLFLTKIKYIVSLTSTKLKSVRIWKKIGITSIWVWSHVPFFAFYIGKGIGNIDQYLPRIVVSTGAL